MWSWHIVWTDIMNAKQVVDGSESANDDKVGE